MQDVARLAGTSAAVVSYVLNDGPRPVAPATRERVLAAVAELDYRPNNAARSLRRQRTQVFGLVIPNNAHPFFAEFARVFETLAYEHRHVVVTGNSLGEASREKDYFELFREHQMAGVMLAVDPSVSVDGLRRASIPVVVLDEPSPGTTLSSVTIDNRAAARDATRHLIGLGHRSIAVVGGPEGLPSADLRFAGWGDAMAEAGLPSRHVERIEFTRHAGYQAGLRLLATPERPTAVFVSSDQQAIGLLRAAVERGVRVPEDVAVMAFDDSDDCLYTNPQLSTVRQPIGDMVRRGLDLLLTPPEAPVHERFAHELVLRGSTHRMPLVDTD